MFVVPLFEQLYISESCDFVTFKTTIRSGVTFTFEWCFLHLPKKRIIPEVMAMYGNYNGIYREPNRPRIMLKPLTSTFAVSPTCDGGFTGGTCNAGTTPTAGQSGISCDSGTCSQGDCCEGKLSNAL
jgi:hypothetical protein